MITPEENYRLGRTRARRRRTACGAVAPVFAVTFITPPFPGYVSGHSTVSAASAKTLELFTGSDKFQETEKRKAGESHRTRIRLPDIQMRYGKIPADKNLTCDVVLQLPTFCHGGDGRHLPSEGRLPCPG